MSSWPFSKPDTFFPLWLPDHDQCSTKSKSEANAASASSTSWRVIHLITIKSVVCDPGLPAYMHLKLPTWRQNRCCTRRIGHYISVAQIQVHVWATNINHRARMRQVPDDRYTSWSSMSSRWFGASNWTCYLSWGAHVAIDNRRYWFGRSWKVNQFAIVLYTIIRGILVAPDQWVVLPLLSYISRQTDKWLSNCVCTVNLSLADGVCS